VVLVLEASSSSLKEPHLHLHLHLHRVDRDRDHDHYHDRHWLELGLRLRPRLRSRLNLTAHFGSASGLGMDHPGAIATTVTRAGGEPREESFDLGIFPLCAVAPCDRMSARCHFLKNPADGGPIVF
jgi:hypothetical protein